MKYKNRTEYPSFTETVEIETDSNKGPQDMLTRIGVLQDIATQNLPDWIINVKIRRIERK